MKIEELKRKIEQEEYRDQSIIFINIDNCEFLVHQYIHGIISVNNYIAVIVENITDIPVKNSSFISLSNDYYYIYYTDKEEELRRISQLNNCCIIYTGKKLKDFLDIEQYVIEVPKLEGWQIRDYVITRLGNDIDEKDLNYLLDISNNDLFRLERELDKITIFNEQYRKDILKKFIKGGVFDESNISDTFDLVEAVVKRNPEEAYHIYSRLNNQGINVFGVINLLYSNFKNIIKIQLSPNPSPESTGLKPGQFWAIKKNNTGFYHKKELLYIFGLLTDMDRRIKTGEITTNNSLEYLLLNIFKL